MSPLVMFRCLKLQSLDPDFVLRKWRFSTSTVTFKDVAALLAGDLQSSVPVEYRSCRIKVIFDSAAAVFMKTGRVAAPHVFPDVPLHVTPVETLPLSTKMRGG